MPSGAPDCGLYTVRGAEVLPKAVEYVGYPVTVRKEECRLLDATRGVVGVERESRFLGVPSGGIIKDSDALCGVPISGIRTDKEWFGFDVDTESIEVRTGCTTDSG